MNVTAKIALHLIPEQLKSQPVFLCIDDTMISKFGTKFENISKLFDHAAHNGCNYRFGHCFVSLMLCVPVWNHNKISYLAVPLGYRMWQKKESKLELAASMVRQVMPEFSSQKNVIILCDSWYTKQNLVSIVEEYPNNTTFRTCFPLFCYKKRKSLCHSLGRQSRSNFVQSQFVVNIYILLFRKKQFRLSPRISPISEGTISDFMTGLHALSFLWSF